MSRSLLSTPLMLVAAVLTFGCSKTEEGPPPPEFDPETAAQKAMADYDSDGDGFISVGELAKSPPLKSAMSHFDANGDGKLSEEEILQRLEYYKKAKAPYWATYCVVSLDGAPLPGAKVTFIPEPFLGAVIHPATGETDANGMAHPIVDKEYQGIQIGLFRVQVTKAGSSIPKKYNETTVLGQEVAPDVRELEHGLRYNVTSQ